MSSTKLIASPGTMSKLLPKGVTIKTISCGLPKGFWYHLIQSTPPYLKRIVLFEDQLWTHSEGKNGRVKLTVVDEELQKRMIIGRLVDFDEIQAFYNLKEERDEEFDDA